MIEIIILGRGGQGAQTAGNMLAQAFFAGGKYVQTFATYGGARRGTPVMSSLRVDDRPIRLRSNITNATLLLCFDDSLLDDQFLSLASEGAQVVVNTGRAASNLAGTRPVNIIPLDGRDIARRNGLGKVVNSALLGGLVAALGQPDIDTMCEVIQRAAPGRKQENVNACRDAYQTIAGAAAEA